MPVIKDSHDPDEVGRPGDKPEKDPIEEALQVKKRLMADDIIETEAAKIKADRKEAEARVAKAENPPPPSGFQMEGKIKLGEIDIQKDREKREAEIERLRKEADDSARATGVENQQLRDKIHQLEQDNLKTTLQAQQENLKTTFQAQMENLQKIIEAQGSQKSFIQQYNEAMETAKTLGFLTPGTAPGTTGSAELTLQIKRLDFEQTVALRKLARDEKESDRKWQMELQRLQDERTAKQQELEAQKKRDEMYGSGLQMLGGAIAKGIMESEEGKPIATAPKGKVSSHHWEAAPGEAGEGNCPECGEAVGIGPTARAAVCPQCGLKILIKRVGEAPSPVAAEEEG